MKKTKDSSPYLTTLLKINSKFDMSITKEDLRQKNFKPEDFFVSDTAKRLGIINDTNDQNILICLKKVSDKIQEIRDYIKVPITVTSGYRNPETNKAVGGSRTSKHMSGLAIDCNAKGYSPDDFVKIIKESKISVDKCFVERFCVHIQFCLDDSKNANYFGIAERINGKWVVKPL